MKKTLTTLAFFIMTISLFGQVTYTGTIDKYPIEFVTHIYSDGLAKAYYAYTKFDEPIRIDGKLKGNLLTLSEKDSQGKSKATLTFKNFNPKNSNIEGVWKDLKTNKELNITLTKSFDVENDETTRELLQPASLKDKYFRVMVKNAAVVGVKIFEKNSDKLLQQLDMECQLWGIDNIETNDFNFDGIQDFSVFEQSYAGPNTSSLYFLYDPKTGKYVKSSFQGTSLEFDKKIKRVFEHNQCCAGRGHMNAEYKIVNNEMILVKKTCEEYDEKTKKNKKIKCD